MNTIDEPRLRGYIRPEECLRSFGGSMDNNWKEELANRLRTARGVTSQAAVAARCGISSRTIGLIEMQKMDKPPRNSTIIRLALATDSDPMEWLSIVGRTVRPEVIDKLRKEAVFTPSGHPPVESGQFMDLMRELVDEQLSSQDLRPWSEIERTLKEYVEHKISVFNLPSELENRILAQAEEHIRERTTEFKHPSSIRAEWKGYIDSRIADVGDDLKALIHRLDYMDERLNRLATQLARLGGTNGSSARETKQAE